MPDVGQIASVNGVELYYEVHGEGPPLVLLHGGLCTIELNFAAMIPRLAEHHQVIGVELQGHGHTPDAERDPSLEHHADDIAALLSHLGIERADIYGFSLGGLVGLTLALRHPDRVGKLVVAAIDHRPDQTDPEDPPPVEDPDDPRMPTPEDFRQMREAYDRVAPDPEHFEVFAERNNVMVHALRGWSNAELASVRCPTLVLVGDNDFTPVRHALEMSELIRDAQLAVLPGTTHMGIMHSPDRVLALVVPFLAGD
jgi:pimeloyl-ACP methyl ester carboxylesterase